MNRLKKALDIFSTVVLIAATVLVVAVFVLRISGARPKLFGYYLFNVMSDSMAPMLEVEDVILVKENDGKHLHKGDVITYRAESGEMAGKDITHRVEEEPVTDTGGTVRIQTKGIKPGAIKDPVITSEQVIGKYVGKLKVVSLIYKLFRKWYGLAIFLALIFVLIGKEMFNLMRLSDKVEKVENLSEEEIKQILKEAQEKREK